MSTKDELRDVEKELLSAEQRLESLYEWIKRCEESLSEAKEEAKKLDGGWSRDGVISRLESKADKLKLKLSHEDKPVVVWEKEPYDAKDQIVHKVTAKRIYVSKFGHTGTTQFNKDGTPVSNWDGYGKIDVEATFGGPCPEKMK